MRAIRGLMVLVLSVAWCAVLGIASASAATYTWTNAAGGSWPTAGNWSGNNVGNGADNTADFSTLDLAADAAVTLDGARTIGNLVYGDTTPSNNCWPFPATIPSRVG